ncbi:MAG: PAS domain-containing protein, partial [Bacteroidota bacterium]|nr:PAS domain-containing protein [Bacteroidota bacterium]
IIGQPFTDDSHPEDFSRFQEVISKCLQQPGKVVPLIIQKTGAKGETLILEWEFVAIKTFNAKITELQGMGRDVTEEIKSVEKIKEFTQRINDILESITDGFYAIDKNWNFTYVNKEFERLFHCKRKDIMGTSIWDQFPESTSLKFYKEYQRAMQEQVKVQFEEFYPRFNCWFDVAAYPGADGLTVYFQDITQRKLAQKKEFEDAQNLNALINNPHALIWSVNRNYQLITANQPFLDIMALRSGKKINKGDSVLYSILDSEIAAKWVELYERAFKGEIYTIEDQIFSQDGVLNYVEVSFNPIRDHEGNIVGTGCFSRDITENKRHQLRIQEQNEKLKEIAWIQSHKVRVPVANILGLVNIFNYKNVSDPFNLEVLANLNIVTQDLDKIIREIVNKTNEVEENPSGSPNNTLMLGDRISTRMTSSDKE